MPLLKSYKLIFIIIIMSLAGCREADKLQFEKYPGFKLGFTTQNFTDALTVNLGNSLKLISYASSKGYSWIELRDPDAKLTIEECKRIASFAKEENIEVAYAIQRGLLDEDYWEVFKRGIKNALVFKGQGPGPGTFRTLACGKEFNLDKNKKGWSKTEFSQIIANVTVAAKKASETGLKLLLENGLEAIHSNDSIYFGTEDLFLKLKHIGLQFDTANPFSLSRVHSSSEEVKSFLQKNSGNLFYIHLKSSLDGQAQPVLMDNPLPFLNVFEIMHQNGVDYIAIELTSVNNEKEVYQNLDKSIRYLKKEGFLSPSK